MKEVRRKLKRRRLGGVSLEKIKRKSTRMIGRKHLTKEAKRIAGSSPSRQAWKRQCKKGG